MLGKNSTTGLRLQPQVLQLCLATHSMCLSADRSKEDGIKHVYFMTVFLEPRKKYIYVLSGIGILLNSQNLCFLYMKID